MIKEAYCSYEVSKLLKEKGFDEPCRTYYQDGKFVDDVCTQYYQWNSKSPFGHISAPTHQMAMALLREKFHLHINGNVFQDFSNDANGNVVDEWIYWSWDVYSTLNGEMIAEAPLGNDVFDSYEEAVEEAIKYCLEKLI